MLFAQAFFQLPLRRLILLTTNPSVDVLPSLAANRRCDYCDQLFI